MRETAARSGRPRTQERLDLLLRAVAILAPRQPGVLLTVFGDGPYRGALERLADELGIADRVDFRGHVETSREVWETLGRARAAAYDWDEIARRIEALCEKLISARPHPRPLS